MSYVPKFVNKETTEAFLPLEKGPIQVEKGKRITKNASRRLRRHLKNKFPVLCFDMRKKGFIVADIKSTWVTYADTKRTNYAVTVVPTTKQTQTILKDVAAINLLNKIPKKQLESYEEDIDRNLDKKNIEGHTILTIFFSQPDQTLV